jgi:hypothetical protein
LVVILHWEEIRKAPTLQEPHDRRAHFGTHEMTQLGLGCGVLHHAQFQNVRYYPDDVVATVDVGGDAVDLVGGGQHVQTRFETRVALSQLVYAVLHHLRRYHGGLSVAVHAQDVTGDEYDPVDVFEEVVQVRRLRHVHRSRLHQLQTHFQLFRVHLQQFVYDGQSVRRYDPAEHADRLQLVLERDPVDVLVVLDLLHLVVVVLSGAVGWRQVKLYVSVEYLHRTFLYIAV